MPTQDDWQTIDTAPKEGRFLIGGRTITGGGPWHVEVVGYRDRHGAPIMAHDLFTATHWMPCPAPP